MSAYSVRGFFSLIAIVVIALANPTALLGQATFGRGTAPAPGGGGIQEAMRQLSAASAQMKQAQVTFRTQYKEMLIIRQETQKEHNQDPDFVASLQQWTESRKDLSFAKSFVIARLKNRSPEYKKALLEKETVKRQINNSDYYVEEFDGLTRRYARAISTIARLEKEAMQANQDGTLRQEQANEANASFRELVKKREDSINNNAHLNNAKNSVKAAKANLDMATRQHNVALQNLARAQQQWAQTRHGRQHRHF